MASGGPEIGGSECDDGDVDPTPREACAKAPQFGAGEGGELDQYTEYFVNAKLTNNLQSGMNPAEPQRNGDVGPRPAVASPEVQDTPSSLVQGLAHSKANLQAQTNARRGNQAIRIPQFGDRNTDPSQAESYATTFARAKEERQTPLNNAKKTKNLQSGFEPQMNGDVGPGPAVASRDGQERPSSVAQAPAHPKANLQPQTSARRGNQAGRFPQFGGWNTDLSQAEGYTGEFRRAREERRTATNNDTPRNYGREPWIRDLFVGCGQHRPPVHEGAYGGGIRTRYDQIGSGAQIPSGNASQVNLASTPRNLMPTMSTIHQPEQKPTKQTGRRFYWFRKSNWFRRSNDERNVVP